MNPILNIFGSFRTILCVCPKCNDMVRLSELHLKYKGEAKKTWLDEYDKKSNLLEKKEELFDRKESEVRNLAAERGRKKVDKIVKKSMDTEFAKLNYNPYDIKTILHPVDFIIFDGMEKGSISDIMLLSRKTDNQNAINIWKSIADAVKSQKYDWKTARVDIEGKIEFTEK